MSGMCGDRDSHRMRRTGVLCTEGLELSAEQLLFGAFLLQQILELLDSRAPIKLNTVRATQVSQ